jgi:hypothetical protein
MRSGARLQELQRDLARLPARQRRSETGKGGWSPIGLIQWAGDEALALVWSEAVPGSPKPYAKIAVAAATLSHRFGTAAINPAVTPEGSSVVRASVR